jgi:iron complex transport system permease protein
MRMRPLTIQRVLLRCGILAVILFVVVVIALKLGAVPVSLYGLGRDLLRVMLRQSSGLSSDYGMIVIDIRLPRILLGIVVGASLSVAGTSFQALLRNPLADPYVLGVSSGAAVGAILALIVEPHLALAPDLAALFTPIGAFLGAAVTIAAVYLLGRREGNIDTGTLLLAGIISASFLSAIIMFLITTTVAGNNLRGVTYWLMGDLSTAPPRSLHLLLGLGFFLAAGAIYTTASDLNLLLAGEKEAMHLGVDVRRVRIVVYIAASILTGLAVSVSGAIGYVGLLVPHVMRLIFGSDHRVLLPTAALGGAIAVVIADTLARTVVAPAELPVGAMTALAGAPLFIYLLRRRLA